MKKFLIIATALLAGAAVAQTAPVGQPAPAVPPAPPAPMALPMHDKVMTRAEVVQMVREHFGQMDSDKDGVIAIEDIKARHKSMAGMEGGGPHAMMRDHGGDPNAAFDRLDANKDGSISREEFAKAHEQRIERRIEIREQRQEGKEGAKDGKQARHAMRMGGFGGGRMIVMADTDKDGKITLAEAEALALKHFDQMDTNKDGVVTPEERRAGKPMIIKRTIEEKKTNS